MQQKYYWIIGIIVLAAIIGIVFTSIPSQKDTGKPEPQMAPAPYVDVEATVTSLFLDDLYSACEAPGVCPKDRATIKIDKVIDRVGYEFPPIFSILLASEDACLEARDFVSRKPSIEEVGPCEVSKVWVGGEAPDQKSPKGGTGNGTGFESVPGYRGVDSPSEPGPRRAVIEGYRFSGRFVAGFNREDERGLREALQKQFESELSISPYVLEGDEFEFGLKYSARPAKLREGLSPNCRTGEVFKSGSCVQEGCESPECPVSSPQYDKKPAELEGDYIVYHLPQRTDEVTEKTLPGLEEGSKIKIRIWQVPNFEIGEYEFI